MRTGNFRVSARMIRVGWLRRPRTVQVLMVEVEEPVDATMTRARSWREASASDALAFEREIRELQMNVQTMQGVTKRYQERLDSIHELAGLA